VRRSNNNNGGGGIGSEACIAAIARVYSAVGGTLYRGETIIMNQRILVAILMSLLAAASFASETGDYEINSGDVLEVLVWNEEALSREVKVRPDGFISLPLVGEVRTGGLTPAAVSESIKTSLGAFLNDTPTVTVSLLSMDGNIVYVLGKVNRPGAFPISTKVDVTQALAWAGGLNTYADEKDIQVLRRDAAGVQRALPFNYAGVKSGKKLESNIVLKSGDVVVVP
jgi:polysaccharide biosynthesis/export protein